VSARPRFAGLALVAAAGVALAVPWPASLVESAFSSTLYPPWQRAATTATNLVPFATFDLVIAGAIAGLVTLAVRAWRRTTGPRLRRLGAALGVVAAVAAGVYLWFLASWGLNYQRVPVATRLGLDRARATPAAAARFAAHTVRELNRLRPLAHARPWPTRTALAEAMRPAFAAAVAGLRQHEAVPGYAKRSLLQPWFRWAGIDGVTNPFVPEVVVNTDLLAVEWPFTLAHEWGHLAGLAHESEASYAGWLTCLGADDQARYSAHLWVFGHAVGSLPRSEQEALTRQLDPGAISDLRAIAARSAQSVPVVRRVSWATYDRYLKTNRVSEGLRSYDAALVLILAGLPE
jgi:hypothetical protein